MDYSPYCVLYEVSYTSPMKGRCLFRAGGDKAAGRVIDLLILLQLKKIYDPKHR